MNIPDFNVQEMADEIMKAVKKARSELVKLNVMVMGKTGVGKSTLINNMFSEPLAEVGIGKPVTDEIRKFEKPDFPLAIYDTPGLELGGVNSVEKLLAGVTKVITEGIATGDVGQAIHCIWYCVSTPSHRFEKTEKLFIQRFLEETGQFKVPVIIVLTQSYSKADTLALKTEIEKENLGIVQVVPVLASNFEINEEYTAKAYGLDRLTEVMDNVIPEAVRNTLVAVQKANIRLKQKKAQLVVASSAATAAATGAVPIPFSDAALLVPEQIAMLAGITAVFGLPVEKSTITAVVSATIGTVGTTVLGKTVISGIFKLIPGVGSVIGGMISGSVAAAITAALGEAYIGIMTMVAQGEMKVGEIDSEEGKKAIARLFKKRLKLKRDDNGIPEIELKETKSAKKALPKPKKSWRKNR